MGRMLLGDFTLSDNRCGSSPAMPHPALSPRQQAFVNFLSTKSALRQHAAPDTAVSPIVHLQQLPTGC